MNIKILGSGCKTCKELYKDVEDVTKAMKLECSVEYINDIQKVMEYGVMSVPALVINEQVVSTGKTLSKKEIEEVLKGNAVNGCDCSNCSCNGGCN